MNDNYENSRWWENYLVRYFVPSIAGMLIITWIAEVAGNDFKNLLLLGGATGKDGFASLILLFLYGNLFCYIASYPILVFHATRVLDFPKSKWKASFMDGYLITVLLVVTASINGYLDLEELSVLVSLGLVVAFSGIQLIRIFKAMRHSNYKGMKESASRGYVFSVALSKRRGSHRIDTSDMAPESDDDDRGLTVTEVKNWKREIVETYRHMREHGNSAFIFSLELALAGILIPIVTYDGMSGLQKMASVGSMMFLWTIPAVFTHLYAQTFERRFSLFDRR
ncbi:MAG: hypothetical protein R3270_03590 [Gammaproteobacteria bacterium]|nr:hypothetical protein [Gammaproteobacteria bacterium]